MSDGLIIKAVSGVYTVRTQEGDIACHARGVFRHRDIVPLVGDIAEVEISQGTGYITAVRERRNELVRPPVANVDRMCLVLSVCDPAPNYLVADTIIALAEHKGIEPFIVVTKTDIADGREVADIYRRAGFTVCEVAGEKGADEVCAQLEGRITVLAGNSGAGKSMLLNHIDPELALAVGETSKKLGRGRHTTRHTELYPLKNGGYVADTPGFSSIEMERAGVIFKDELQYCFREFADYVGQCRFTGCSHRTEKGCAVLEAVRRGEIPEQRHRSYTALYNEALEIKECQYK